MRRRNSTISSDSLELLLDTICNTFGAVIFISMLAAVLVSRSSRGHDEDPQAVDPATEVASIQTEIQAAQERVRVLNAQVRQQKLVTERFASADSLALAQEIREQTQGQVALVNEKSDVIADIAATRGSSAQLEYELTVQQQELDKTKKQNDSLKAELEQQEQVTGRTARIPQVRKTAKQSCVYALDDNQLHRVTTSSGMIDHSDCKNSLEQGIEVIRPRSGSGLAVSEQTPSDRIQRKFADISPRLHFVQLFVSRDSFSAFLAIKDVLVALGVEYEVIITKDDKVELFLGTSQRESFVQ